jgi:hypothetical protein
LASVASPAFAPSSARKRPKPNAQVVIARSRLNLSRSNKPRPSHQLGQLIGQQQVNLAQTSLIPFEILAVIVGFL